MKILIAFLLCIATFLLFGCSKPYIEVNNFISNLDAHNINCIKVSTVPEAMLFKEFSISDQEDITKVVDYFKSLNTSKTRKDPNVYAGGGYYLEFQYKEGDKTDVLLDGNMFIIIKNQTKAIAYEEAIAFDKLIGDIMLNKYRSEYANTILTGEITYISELSPYREYDGDQICKINNSDKTIDITNSYVFDTRGLGEGLSIGSHVEIFYQDNHDSKLMIDGKTVKPSIVADSIFIVDR